MAYDSGRELDLTRPLARVNALSFAAVFAGVLGAATGLVTAAIAALGVPPRLRWIGLLDQYFPGYSLSAAGAFAGLFWAFAFGFVLSFPPAWLYYRGVLRQIARHPDRAPHAGPGVEVARIGVPYFAASFGLLCGLTVLVATLWLLLKHRPGEPLGPRLGLLSQYLPGYSVSIAGGLVGFLWVTALGAAGFAVVGWVYNRIVTASRPGARR